MASTLVDVIVTALSTLAAAFAGSWYAFRLNDKSAARNAVGGQVAAINRAQFVLMAQISFLRNVQAQLIDPVREHPGRFLAMRPSLTATFADLPKIDLGDLLFLLETDDRNLVGEILVECQRFENVAQGLAGRSRLHLEVAQPKLAAANIQEGLEYTEADIVGALGFDLTVRLQRETDSVIALVDSTVDSSVAMVATFYAAMKLRYPKLTVIRLAPIPDAERRRSV